MKRNKAGDTRGFNPRNPSKNHPWRARWSFSENSLERSIKSGFKV